MANGALNGQSNFFDRVNPYLSGASDLVNTLAAGFAKDPEAQERAARLLLLSGQRTGTREQLRQKRHEAMWEESKARLDSLRPLTGDPRAAQTMQDENSALRRAIEGEFAIMSEIGPNLGMSQDMIEQERNVFFATPEALPAPPPDAMGTMQNPPAAVEQDDSLARARHLASEMMQMQAVLDEAPNDDITRERLELLRQELLHSATRESVIIPMVGKKLTNTPLTQDEEVIMAVLDQLGFWDALMGQLLKPSPPGSHPRQMELPQPQRMILSTPPTPADSGSR